MIAPPALAVDAGGPNEIEIARLACSDRSSWWIRGRRAVVGAVLRRTGKAGGGMIADLGCGAGGMFEALAEFGVVLGMDFSPLAVQLCRSKGYRGLAIATVEHIPLRPESLGLAGLTDVLEHVQRDDQVIRECFRVLEPGGLLVVTVPALPWLYGDHDRALGHVRRYTHRDLRALMTRSGFLVEQLTHFNTLLLPLAVIGRLIRRREQHAPQTDPLDLPAPWNWLAFQILLLERVLIRFAELPVGLSLLCVARKPRVGHRAQALIA